MRGQASSSQASRSQGTAPDDLPALRDDSWNEDEPVSGVRTDASPGKPDFFVPLIVIDELPCARRQDVMAAVFALRHLTLETQSLGKLPPHGHLYVARSRVKNCLLYTSPSPRD